MTDHALPTKVPAASQSDDSDGMSYLESLPRRLVTLYLPLFIILVVLLFPFYWMGLTSIKPDEQLIDMEKYNPFWVVHPTFKHISKLLFETQYPRWLSQESVLKRNPGTIRSSTTGSQQRVTIQDSWMRFCRAIPAHAVFVLNADIRSTSPSLRSSSKFLESRHLW